MSHLVKPYETNYEYGLYNSLQWVEAGPNVVIQL